MNIEQARDNMFKQQIRTWEVLDPQVLELLAQVPREKFVSSQYQQLAFADVSISIGHGRTMMPPKEEARIIQALQVKPSDKVLVLGAGSGYLTALLAKQGRWVYSVDSQPDFHQQAETVLAALNITNVTFIAANSLQGWEHEAPYDVIVLTGSLPYLPIAFQQALSVNGRLFAVIGNAPVMEATVITRTKQDHWQADKIFETNRERLADFVEPASFTF